MNQTNTREASRKWNEQHVFADRPARDRPGSELTEPNAPIAITTDGYKSVLVTAITKDAFLRISADGFRLITLNKSKDAFCIQGAPGVGWLRSKSSAQAIANDVSSNADLTSAMPAKVTPRTILKAAEGVPNAGLAWATVNDHQFTASWLRDDVKRALVNVRGY